MRDVFRYPSGWGRRQLVIYLLAVAFSGSFIGARALNRPLDHQNWFVAETVRALALFVWFLAGWLLLSVYAHVRSRRSS